MREDPARQQVTDIETAGVIARPPLLFLGALLLGLGLERLQPLAFVVPGDDPIFWTIGACLIFISVALVIKLALTQALTDRTCLCLARHLLPSAPRWVGGWRSHSARSA